ncbi:hypothetical protein SKAU_G00002320 [Synaphobranchus kaupii]|uniref:Uncharacterized protein n=1 Tax=Synaphobranchus kaupii TaxID=118154 RepID=A0A9Q1JCN3_SYNKA|nr:hypothetical protein SKAU_G00002320 [Synaphobranchus kaupii]
MWRAEDEEGGRGYVSRQSRIPRTAGKPAPKVLKRGHRPPGELSVHPHNNVATQPSSANTHQAPQKKSEPQPYRHWLQWICTTPPTETGIGEGWEICVRDKTPLCSEDGGGSGMRACFRTPYIQRRRTQGPYAPAEAYVTRAGRGKATGRGRGYPRDANTSANAHGYSCSSCERRRSEDVPRDTEYGEQFETGQRGAGTRMPAVPEGRATCCCKTTPEDFPPLQMSRARRGDCGYCGDGSLGSDINPETDSRPTTSTPFPTGTPSHTISWTAVGTTCGRRYP